MMNNKLSEENLKKILKEGTADFRYDRELEDNIMDSISALGKPTFSTAYANARRGLYICFVLSIFSLVILFGKFFSPPKISSTDDISIKFLPSVFTLIVILVLFALSEFNAQFKPRSAKPKSSASH